MSGIDTERMAEAVHEIDRECLYRDEEGHKPAWIDCPNQALDLDHAVRLLNEYDRLTAEWQERMRSISISPKATPTRRQSK